MEDAVVPRLRYDQCVKKPYHYDSHYPQPKSLDIDKLINMLNALDKRVEELEAFKEKLLCAPGGPVYQEGLQELKQLGMVKGEEKKDEGDNKIPFAFL